MTMAHISEKQLTKSLILKEKDLTIQGGNGETNEKNK